MSKVDKMKVSDSSEGLCNKPPSDLREAEKIFTTAILPPIYLVAGYLVLLRVMGNGLKAEEDTDPFHRVWWSGPVVFSILYLILIFVGPKLMKDRDEFKIKPYIFTYNLYQCILNIWCVAAMIYEVYTNPIFPAPWGNVAVPGAPSFRISFLVWVHYNNKFVELLDTVFMVLRKKNEQISFLHCYHHLLLVWSWFMVCKVGLGGDVYFGACVNSFVHVIMYGYYTMALLNIPCPWKKWITKCQLGQFCLVLTHSAYVVWKGNAPLILPLAQAFVMINMLVLFTMFYNKKYNKKPEAPAKKIE